MYIHKDLGILSLECQGWFQSQCLYYHFPLPSIYSKVPYVGDSLKEVSLVCVVLFHHDEHI